MEFERARLEREGAVAILSMNHPEVLNAASAEMLKGLTDALHALAGSSDRTRCLIITGTGRAFSDRAQPAGTRQWPDAARRRPSAGDAVPSIPAAPARPALSDRH
jgi:enoyl-CoA hydratase/carnithine racemase